jgi:hypothetical protein
MVSFRHAGCVEATYAAGNDDIWQAALWARPSNSVQTNHDNDGLELGCNCGYLDIAENEQ